MPYFGCKSDYCSSWNLNTGNGSLDISEFNTSLWKYVMQLFPAFSCNYYQYLTSQKIQLQIRAWIILAYHNKAVRLMSVHVGLLQKKQVTNHHRYKRTGANCAQCFLFGVFLFSLTTGEDEP